MEIPESYFEDEVREGFFIPSMMKRCWAAQMEVLSDIDALCKKYNIAYFADSGTLIGAVRHGGFIPWDDDLDIGMTRENYELFLEHADELPDNYTVLNWRKTPEWINAFSRVVNTTSIRFDEEFLNQYHEFPYSAGVDVFVFDYLYRDKEKEAKRTERAKLLLEIGEAISKHGDYDESVEKMVRDVEEMYGFDIVRSEDIPMQIFAVAEPLLCETPREEADEIALMPAYFRFGGTQGRIITYEETIRVPFELTEIPVSIHYDEVLHARYGEYMKVYRNGGMHDYPYYKAQEKILVDKTGWRFWNYRWNLEEVTLGLRIRQEQEATKEGIKEKIAQIESMIESNPDVYGSLRGHLDVLKQNVHLGSSGREEVVFLTVGGDAWKNFDYFYRKEAAYENTDVYVIPIPFFDLNLDGTVRQNHYVTEGIPGDVTITSFNDYNLEARHPKRIYFQIPYDGENPAYSLHPVYFSGELLKYTEELIYVPCLDIYEMDPGDEKAFFCMDYYVKMPGIMHADKVILPTENLKENYIRALVEFAGEDTKNLWEEKIQVEDYRPKKEAEGGKKKILYYTNFSSFVSHRDLALDKIRRNLDVFFEASDQVELYWMISRSTKEVLLWKCPEAYEKLMELYRKYEADGWGRVVTSEDDPVLAMMDAFYGEPGKLAHIANANKIPVMIQNVEC